MDPTLPPLATPPATPEPGCPPAGPDGEPEASGAHPTEGKAVVALWLALVGLAGALCGISLLFGLPAMVLGLFALRDIRRSQGRLQGRGLARAAVGLGFAGSTLFFAWLAVVTAVLAPADRDGSAWRTQVFLVPIAPPDPPLPEGMGPEVDPPHLQMPLSPGLELHREAGPLAAQLARLAHDATASGEIALVETTAANCDACEEVETAMLDPRTRAALRHVRVLDVDVGEFHADLGRLRMDENTAPWFYLLDAKGEPRDAINAGEWDDNEPSQIAPVLHAFVLGKLHSRRQRWNHGWTL